MTSLPALLDASGRAIVGWLSHAMPSATLLLLAAIGLDMLVARHVRASLRMALYAPVAIRVLMPATWTVPAHDAYAITTLLTPVPDALVRPVSTGSGPQAVAWWAVSALIVYAAVAVALAARIVVARRVLAKVTRSARPYYESPSLAAMGVPVAVHDSVGPLVEGIFRPRIVLPARLLAREQKTALSCVLAHEHAHVQRRDPCVLALMQLVTVVAWPFAPIWIAAWRVRRLIEVACDEAAVKGASDDERRRYGHTLLDLAANAADAHAIAALGMGARTLRARIVALASSRRWPRAMQLCVVGGAFIVLAACGTAGRAEDSSGTNARQGLATFGSPAKVSGAAVPRAALHDLYPCAKAGIAKTTDGMSGWQLVEPPPAAADPALLALCQSAPYVDAMQKHNWAAEARFALAQIGKDMSAAYADHAKRGKPSLCPSGAPTPPTVPFADAPVQARAQWDTDPSWVCMDFSFTIPVMFQYRIASTESTFSATAIGRRKDAAGHTTELSVVLRGQVDPAGELWLASSLEETWRTL